MPTSRHFGAISSTSETLDAVIHLETEPVRLDLNLAAPETLDVEALSAVDRLVDELARLDAVARAALTAALPDEAQQPAQFWRFHREEVEGYERLARDVFVDALALKRVGFYPDGAHRAQSFLVMDYALRGPQTDQLLVVKLRRDESLVSIAWES